MGIHKKIVAVIIIVIMLITNTVYFAFSDEQQEEITQRANLFAGVMEEILKYYVGEKVTVQQLYESAMGGMMLCLDDYTDYFSKDDFTEFLDYLSAEIEGFGIVLEKNLNGEIKVTQVIEDSNAEKAGLMVGDILTHINKLPIKKLSDEQIDTLIYGNDEIEFTVNRNGQINVFKIKKSAIQAPTVFVKQINDLPISETKGDVSKSRYVRIELFSEHTDKEMEQVIAKMKEDGVSKVVFDLRGNPGGYTDTAVNICQLLVNKGVIFSAVDSSNKKTVYRSNLDKSPFGKMVVLVDGETASAAEVMASALQDSKSAKIVGTRTYGKGVIQSLVELVNGDGLKYTSMEYFRRNGGKINGIGVKPDIEVEMPIYITGLVLLYNDNTSPQLPDVKKVLKELGYTTGKLDENYDTRTQNSIVRFQSENNLNSTGNLDPETIMALNAAVYSKRIKGIDKELDVAVKELLK